MHESILNRFYSQPLALELNSYLSIERILLERSNGIKISAEEAKVWAASSPYGSGAKSTKTEAVIGIYGPIINRASGMAAMSGITDAQAMASLIRAAADMAGVDAIKLDIDSPGGEAVAADPIVDAMSYAKSLKPVDAFVSGMSASLGFLIASQAQSITATKSSMIGSMSVMFARRIPSAEGSRYKLFSTGDKKLAFSGDEPLTDEHSSEIMRVAQQYHSIFMSYVSSGRGQSDVSSWFDGRVETAETALKLGWIDAIGSIHDSFQDAPQVMTTRDLKRR